MKLKKHLEDIRGRLEGDVGFLLKSIQRRNRRKPLIGFFAMTRMLMPIIESVARAEGISPQDLLARLDRPAPKLTWALYRNVFMHNDEFQYGRVGRRGIPTGISITTKAQEKYLADLLKKTSYLDVGALYRELLSYLDRRIAEVSPRKNVQYISGIWFPGSKKLAKVMKAELDQLT